MSYYINEKLFEEITSGKPPKKKKEDPRLNYGRTQLGRRFLAVNRTMVNGNGEYISSAMADKTKSGKE